MSLNGTNEGTGGVDVQSGVHDDATRFVRVFGYREMLRLDRRFRFRVPDHLAVDLHRELGRVVGASKLPPGAFHRLAFYMVPGPGQKMLLYPSPNIELAVERFENPAVVVERRKVRAARDYFYGMMRFVEADRQNRIVVPEHLRQHAGIDGREDRVLLVAHNQWLVLMKGSLAAQEERAGKEALEEIGADVLDPVGGPQGPAEKAGQ